MCTYKLELHHPSEQLTKSRENEKEIIQNNFLKKKFGDEF